MKKDKSVQSRKYDWINVKEATELLGISRQTLHGLIREGHLPAYRIEGVRGVKFHRADVLELIKPVEPGEVDLDDSDWPETGN